MVLQCGFVSFSGNGVLSFLTVAMEVRSETGITSAREPFGVAMQKSSTQNQPAIQSMRLAYSQDGTAIYKPVTSNSPSSPPSTSPTTLSYQGGDRGGGSTGSGVEGPSPLTSSHGLNINIGEPVKRKRGRPRKYGPDGIVALAPTSAAASVPPGASGCSPLFPGTTKPVSWADPTKKARGRPSGSGKKQQMAALGNPLLYVAYICRSDDFFNGIEFLLLQHGMDGLLFSGPYLFTFLGSSRKTNASPYGGNERLHGQRHKYKCLTLLGTRVPGRSD